MKKTRFWVAMALYGVLALAAGLTLERTPAIVVWLLLGAFAFRTWIALKRQGDDRS